MTPPFILPLPQCTDLDLAGGKAVGLAQLISAGFSVPQGFCVTTEAYRQSLHTLGFIDHEMWLTVCRLPDNERRSALARCRDRIKEIEISQLASQGQMALETLRRPPSERWAVRSSATNEDATQTSFAGLYRTHLGVALSDIEAAIKDLWTSLWEERVISYMAQQHRLTPPRMAVLIQPMVAAQTAGVMYSIHPVTGRRNQVMINAIPGLAAPLADGTITPDQYVVDVASDGEPPRVRTRVLAEKSRRLSVSHEGLRTDPLEEGTQHPSSLTDGQLFSLARTAKQVEQALRRPMDIEWAFDSQQLWLVQSRPVTNVHTRTALPTMTVNGHGQISRRRCPNYRAH